MTTEHQPVVLIAEDDANHMALLRRALDQTGFGWPVHCVTDGAAAIAYLSGEGKFSDREKFPLPNILLLDLKMPHTSGFDVLQWLHESASELPTLKNIRVVVLTASDEIRDVNRAYQLGAASFLTKPVEFNEFKDMVSALLTYWTAMNSPGTVLNPKEKPLQSR